MGPRRPRGRRAGGPRDPGRGSGSAAVDDRDHTERALKRARRSIEDSYAEEYPDFREALTAAIERHNSGKCEEQQQALDERNSDPTPTPTATATPGGSATPAPTGGSTP